MQSWMQHDGERSDWPCSIETAGAAGRAASPGGLKLITATPFQWDPDQDPYALDGLQTLCRECHHQKTREENFNPDRLEWDDYMRDLIRKHGEGPE